MQFNLSSIKFPNRCKNARIDTIEKWHSGGGVLILGYEIFRTLSNEKVLQESLINPGPDMIVCDEGHLLKNVKTALYKAVNRLTTKKRIILSGTPLQNNLTEYFNMVEFVKPNLLGNYKDYLSHFVNPIRKGKYINSTPYEIQMMKQRSHVLHELLDECVLSRDYSVMRECLPPKQEYVLYIRPTKLQIDLYKVSKKN